MLSGKYTDAERLRLSNNELMHKIPVSRKSRLSGLKGMLLQLQQRVTNNNIIIQ